MQKEERRKRGLICNLTHGDLGGPGPKGGFDYKMRKHLWGIGPGAHELFPLSCTAGFGSVCFVSRPSQPFGRMDVKRFYILGTDRGRCSYSTEGQKFGAYFF